MPELPEVETIRKQLAKEIQGFVFSDVRTDAEKMFKPSFKVVSSAINNQKIESVSRQAKLLIFNLSSGFSLLFHLKLTGRLLVRKPSDPADEFTHAVFILRIPDLNPSAPGSKRELRFADARKFGFVKLVTDQKEMEDLLKGFGPEPFKDLTLKSFTKALGTSARPIKIVLLDQQKISGIGNIYANDSLYLAKVHPKKPANKLKSEEVKKLYSSVLEVLRRGLKYGGASDQWYVQVHGEKGEYQKHFLVYGKSGQSCTVCGGAIKRMELGGRGTFFCPVCQLWNDSGHGQNDEGKRKKA